MYFNTGVALVFLAMLALCLLLLWREGLLKRRSYIIVSCALLIVAFTARLLCMDKVSLDYEWFLKDWIQFFRDEGGFRALKHPVGNYNFPYLYFLALFSYLPFYDLILIKLLSVFFDIVLAYSCMKLVGVVSGGAARRLGAFLAVLLLPTVILNGAYWGQCDSIYTSFAVLSIYLALKDKPYFSMAAMAISFSFKLQAVFIMPVFLIMLFTKRIKLRHLPVFPLTFVLMSLPAIVMGRPVVDAITLYINQADSVGSAPNYNSASMFTFFGELAKRYTWICQIGIGLAFGLLFVLFYCTYMRRSKVKNAELLIVAALMAIGVPLFLPHMHERYFFMADIFTLAVGISFLRDLPAPALVVSSSLITYFPFLHSKIILPLAYCTVAVAAALVILFVELALRLKGGTKKLNSGG